MSRSRKIVWVVLILGLLLIGGGCGEKLMCHRHKDGPISYEVCQMEKVRNFPRQKPENLVIPSDNMKLKTVKLMQK